MIYMCKGAFIQLCEEERASKLKEKGFVPMELPASQKEKTVVLEEEKQKANQGKPERTDKKI